MVEYKRMEDAVTDNATNDILKSLTFKLSFCMDWKPVSPFSILRKRLWWDVGTMYQNLAATTASDSFY